MEGWNLCCEKPAGEGRCASLSPLLQEKQPLRLTLAFLRDVADAFEDDPAVFGDAGEARVTALFRGSRCLCADFLENYAPVMGAISRHWPLSVYGTVNGTEVGRLSVDGERWTMYSPSGKPFTVLSDLCVQISAPADVCLRDALMGVSCRRSTVPLDRGLLEESEAAEDGAWFAYLDLLADVSWADRLDALSMEQKETLWEVYLGEGISPLEFEWLWNAYESGDAEGMLEWELALQTALSRLDIRVENDAGGFRVTGERGRFRLDYITSPAAGKLFLKALFPVSFAR